jgi:cytochrome c1
MGGVMRIRRLDLPRRALPALLLLLMACGPSGPQPRTRRTGTASGVGGIGSVVAPLYAVNTGGTAAAGKHTIERFQCGACHTIPGISGAEGVVAPPLTKFARRTFLAGVVPNEPEALVRWIMDPKSIVNQTAMPTLGVTEPEARDIAAYLYTLW